MSVSRENTSIEVRRDKLREKVREMEAFGWVLGETCDMPGRKVKLELWRPLDMPNINKLRKLEYDLSRLPRENLVFSVKWGISLFLILALISVIVGVNTEYLCIVIIMPYVLFWIFVLLITPESRNLAQRRERILHRARMLIEGGDGDVEPVARHRRLPSDEGEIR